MNRPRRPGPAAQRGAAALIVVLLLFFIISLVAAYAGRNLIFEQRTATNQYRATQAFEVAEAGLEWALAMLNGGRVGADCLPPVPMGAQNSFRFRYLSADGAGNLTPVRWVDGITSERPSCVRNGAGWNCSCPTSAAPAPAAPAGGVTSGFRVCFEAVDPPQPGVVRIVSTGRTSFVDRPCDERAEGTAGEAAATVSVVVALSSALATPPTAALTVRGTLNAGVEPILLRNTDRQTNGITALVGAVQLPAPAPTNLTTVPGTPGEASFIVDPPMLLLSPAQMFASVFNMSTQAYRLQPATVLLDCAVDCSAATARAKASENPGRVLWVEGDFDFDSAGTIGSDADPVVLVVTGNVGVSSANAVLHGVLYASGDAWSNTGDLTIEGAAIGGANLAFGGGGPTEVRYDPAILQSLKLGAGSFVRVPGSWRDFP